MSALSLRLAAAFGVLLLPVCLVGPALGDDPPKPAEPKPVTFTAQQDRQNMLDQLKIPADTMRRGPSGFNRSAPDYQNTDEAKANPWPHLPEMMVTKSRKVVDTPDLWWKVRRPEIVEYFDAEVYGRVPKDVPKVTWETAAAGGGGPPPFGGRGGAPPAGTVTKRLVGKVDNSACPAITVNIQLTLMLPPNASGPVPVMMDFGGGGGMQQYLAKGWGYALINPGSIQADNGAGLTRGIIGLCNKGQPRKPDDWGALRAWAWGASRALDYLETDKAVDAKQVGISGLSRYGKAAIVAMAYEPRFAIGLIGSSGEGGAKLHRRNWGEQVENVCGGGEYHWMSGTFLKYGGPLAPCDLPVDAHELIALCAPRPTFISYGASTGQGAEGTWVDQKGSFMAAVAAGPAYKLLGKKDLGTTELPAVGTALVDGELAWRMHSGGHTTGPNIDTFVTWASRYLKAPAAKPAPAEPSPAVARTDANSKKAHEQLLEKAKKGHIDLYFAGDSITRRWGATDYPEFLDNWKKTFHGWNAANFGWGGDTVQNVLWRLQNGELDKVNPKVIVVMAGTNNLGGDEAMVGEITRGLKAVLDVCRDKAPDAVVILMGITPRNDRPALMATVSKVNEEVAKLADGKKVRYLNINDKLADKEGKLLEGMSPDRLHLSVKGYQVWADALKPILTELLGPPAKEDLAPPPTGDPGAPAKPAAKDEPKVTEIPEEVVKKFKLDTTFYKKYVDYKGFSIVSSAKVSDEGLLEARYLIDQLLGQREDILKAMIKRGCHFMVMAPTEMTTDVPEQRHMKNDPNTNWDQRARGLGGRLSSCGEENLLNLRGDRYNRENILIHEFNHAVHQQGLRDVDPTFDRRLREAYQSAMDKGLWKGTYVATNPAEYWAEGCQAYFDCMRPQFGANTREKLEKYDEGLFKLVDEVYKQSKFRYVRYDQRKKSEKADPKKSDE